MNIKRNINLRAYNTFHLDCVATHFVVVTSTDELIELLQSDTARKAKQKLMLGGGSNILLTQPTYEGLVIKNEILGKEIIAEDEFSVTINVGAGENWNEFVRWTIEQGYCGLENLVSIPGSVGAAPMQNIGAYGKEVGEHIVDVHYYDPYRSKLTRAMGEDCGLGYRTSIFKTLLKGRSYITHITFKLDKYTPETYTPLTSYGVVAQELVTIDMPNPADVAGAIAQIRASKLPDRTKLGTAGSFFKNPIIPAKQYEQLADNHPDIKAFPISENQTDKAPLTREVPNDSEAEDLPSRSTALVKLSAGQLIDLAGLKGITQGSVGTYQNHALVLVHHGGGTGQQLVELATHIQQTVYEKFGIALQAEVNYI